MVVNMCYILLVLC